MARVAILGGGNGGFAAAADLARRGHEVTLWNRGPAPVEAVEAAGGIAYRGVFGDGFAPVQATTVLSVAVRDADLVLVCLPALAHQALATALAGHLRSATPLVLDPGGLLGALAFAHHLRAAGQRGPIRLGETGTLSYICRKTGPAGVEVTSVATGLAFAALPAVDTPVLLAEVEPLLPGLVAVEDTLAAGLTSINTVLHPPAMILAAAWIERTHGDFFYYADTAVPSVGRLMAALDVERLAIARAWGLPAEPFLEVFARIGSTTAAAAASGDFQRALEESRPNRHIRAPASLDDRYMREDIPFAVVPLGELGRLVEVATPIIDAIVTIASTITGEDFRARGRTLASIGLDGLGSEAILTVLRHRPA